MQILCSRDTAGSCGTAIQTVLKQASRRKLEEKNETVKHGLEVTEHMIPPAPASRQATWNHDMKNDCEESFGKICGDEDIRKGNAEQLVTKMQEMSDDIEASLQERTDELEAIRSGPMGR